MDTSETYIKMSDCPEIQYSLTDYGFKEKLPRIRKDLWDGKLKMFCLEGDWIVNIKMVGLSVHAIRTTLAVTQSPKLIWLPTQSQLQEMLPKYLPTMTAKGKLDGLSRFLKKQTHGIPDAIHFSLMSMEQLWLAFVMKEKFNKVWSDDKWVANA